MIYKHIDMKFNGPISNSIFCVIHKSCCSILHCFLVISILVIQVMGREVLCNGNCFISETPGLYVYSAKVLHSFSFAVYKYAHFAATEALPHFGNGKEEKWKLYNLCLLA